jgi:multidrug efflux pump subunit AcrA (membrane-fusion protein)
MKRLLYILLPLCIGAATTVWLVSNAQPPARIVQTERTTAARTMVVTPTDMRLTISGYGSARPAWSWQAVTEIGGAITYRHPDLETGKIIPADTTVLEIDPTPYQLTKRQVEADLAALAIDRDQIEIDRAHTLTILELEQQRLALAQRDLDRARALVASGTAPQSRVDDLERSSLQLQRTVRELENTLSLLPTKAARIDAQIARNQAALERAARDLALTRITTPEDIRVGAVHVENHQFAQPGKLLVTGDSIDRIEVTAQMPMVSFARLIGSVSEGLDLTQENQTDILQNLEAELRLVTAPEHLWKGTVLRIESALDPEARSVPVVVAVDRPYEGADPPRRLPLVPNMYVKVSLSAPASAPHIAIPSRAIHDGLVYLRNADGRLELRQIKPAWQQGDRVVIEEGLSPGDEIVLDDIQPAIPGMRILPAELAQ